MRPGSLRVSYGPTLYVAVPRRPDLVPRVGTWLGQWEGGEVDHILGQLHRQVVLERLDMFDERAGSAGAHERPASAAAVRARQ
jgi:hypothetical protein